MQKKVRLSTAKNLIFKVISPGRYEGLISTEKTQPRHPAAITARLTQDINLSSPAIPHDYNRPPGDIYLMLKQAIQRQIQLQHIHSGLAKHRPLPVFAMSGQQFTQ